MDPDNSERYDRQIRLWGTHGQSKCTSAKICLINANALGTEVLKNLCLPGIGSFTIIDSNRISGPDVGSNFFVTADKIGANRGVTAKELLLTLNEQVHGDCIEEPIDTLLSLRQENFENSNVPENSDSSDSQFWTQFSCIVACGQLSEEQIMRLSKTCWNNDIPLVLCRTLGFIGYLRVQVREHCVIEAHPDNSLPDFRLDSPFPELKSHLDSIKLDLSDVSRMNEYPYVILLYKFLEIWRQKNNFPVTRMPVDYQEKREIRQLIEDAMKKMQKLQLERGLAAVELENFLEASKAVNSVFTSNTSNISTNLVTNGSSKINDTTAYFPPQLQQLFLHPRAQSQTVQILGQQRPEMVKFWQIIRAIKLYVLQENEGRLPVSGSITDMASSSSEYVKLQKIYRNKAKEDTDCVFHHCQELIDLSTGSSSSPGRVSYEDVRLICTNIRDIQILRTCPIYNDYSCTAANSDIDAKTRDSDLNFSDTADSNSNLSDFGTQNSGPEEHEQDVQNDQNDCMLSYYLALRTIDRFYSTYGRSPGYRTEQVETDMPKLRQCYKDIYAIFFSNPSQSTTCLPNFTSSTLNCFQTRPNVSVKKSRSIDQQLYELCRYGGAELHTISSFIAGCASQEVIKLVTNQYVPLSGTFIYNGITSTTTTFPF